jgi:NAD(P)-dependent dehydrogenase (short-subunit alcohol dehydrogenase family)
MDSSLKDRRVIVAGASSGIGFATSVMLARDAARLV